MDKEDEVFELVNDADEVIGKAHRGHVHRQGLLHRAVYVWVFSADGAVLLQRRSPLKEFGPSLWDLSVAEHLQPGETYLEGAVRGLSEELGITTRAEELAGPLQPTHKRELHQGEFHDVELVQSYRLECLPEDIVLEADGEVAEVRWVMPERLQDEVAAKPEDFIPWMREEGEALQWFAAGNFYTEGLPA